MAATRELAKAAVVGAEAAAVAAVAAVALAVDAGAYCRLHLQFQAAIRCR